MINVLKTLIDGKQAFDCPGCGEVHALNVAPGMSPCWGWNGSMDKPTFTPSVLFRSGHFADGQSGRDCWCTYEERFGRKSPFECVSCHSFVNDGQIQFLSDCSHALAGQTVPLPPVDID